MNDWSAGYVADIGYTFGYYAELNSLRVQLALLDAGVVCPKFGTACELGFGQGLSTNIHAAGSLTEWHGTDFNPSQAAFAQELAVAAGSGAKLYDEAFAEFVNRSDLPDFDFIGLHGIWSWISDQNRAVIADFIRRKLRVGGVLYVSYNTMPGWAGFAPMRHLMTQHAEVIGAEGHGIVSRINGAVEFAERLLTTNPTYARANLLIPERIKRIKDQNRHYVAHEFFNRDWHPMHFATMAECLESAKVNYACSAHLLDHIDLVNLTEPQQAFLKDIPDRMFRESVRDFMVNQQFRRDYWVKGPRRLSLLQQLEGFRDVKVLLVVPRSGIPLKINGSLGEATLSEAVYAPILDALAEHQPRTIGEIEQTVRAKGVTGAQVRQAAVLLCGEGHLAPVQQESTVASVKPQTVRLNACLMDKARGSGEVGFLASPVTGGGVSVSRFGQLFLLALAKGARQPSEWARFAWDVVSAQGQKLVKDGKALETAEENLSELTSQATEFANKDLPLLMALEIA